MLFEMRQRSTFKPIRCSMPRNSLLTNACYHLRDVDEGAYKEMYQIYLSKQLHHSQYSIAVTWGEGVVILIIKLIKL